MTEAETYQKAEQIYNYFFDPASGTTAEAIVDSIRSINDLVLTYNYPFLSIYNPKDQSFVSKRR